MIETPISRTSGPQDSLTFARLSGSNPESGASGHLNGHVIVCDQTAIPLAPSSTAPDDLRARRSLVGRQVSAGDHDPPSLREAVRARALPTRAEMEAIAGRPKDDFKVLGFTVARRSTGYKAVLDMLDDFHAALGHPSGASPEDRLSHLYGKLTTLNVALAGYTSKSRHTRSDQMRDLQSVVANKQAALKYVFVELKRRNWQLPLGLTLTDLVSRGNLDKFVAANKRGVSVERFAQYSGAGKSIDEALSAIKDSIWAGVPIDAALAFHFHGFSPDQTIGLHKNGFDSETIKDILSLVGDGFSLKRMLDANPCPKDVATAKSFRDGGADLSAMARANKTIGDFAQLNEMKAAFSATNISMGRLVQYFAAGKSIADGLAERDPAIKNGLSADKALEYHFFGFSPREVELLEGAKLGIQAGLEYQRLRIPITEKNLVTWNRLENQQGEMKLLGAGLFNQVFDIEYARPATNFKGVFKPLQAPLDKEPQRVGISKDIGIDTMNPQFGARNIATKAVADLLKFDVVPSADYGLAKHDNVVRMGLVMAKVTGKDMKAERDAIHQNSKTDEQRRTQMKALILNPVLRRELVKLQLLDALVGQGDRHINNYLVERSPATGDITGVKGIDNDQCFGKDTKDPNTLVSGNPMRPGFRGVHLPEIIDSEMKGMILGLDGMALEQALSGLLHSDEIEATKERLTFLQKHIGSMEANDTNRNSKLAENDKKYKSVIDPSEWGDMSVYTRADINNSYLLRDS